MEDIRTRLEDELHVVLLRLREFRAPVTVEELPTPIGGDPTIHDVIDKAQATESRELRLLTTERLYGRVTQLAAALERVERGTYGQCVACGEAIGTARLRVMPEAATCIRCQRAIERRGVGSAA